MEVAVKLEIFEGPLDLLLHLIRKNEVDIYDIPVALITQQYLEYLEMMQELSIAVAGEFLVMASTLTHIKSRMLLPSYDSSEDDESEDPRHDLVERLKEHMRIKNVAAQLEERPWLGRDVFGRGGGRGEVDRSLAGQDEQIEAGVFDLIEAFRKLISRRHEQMVLELPSDRVSVEERMGQLLERLRQRQTLTFDDCFDADRSTPQLVVTFLALLELARLGLIKVYQERLELVQGGEAKWGPLRIYFRPTEGKEENQA